MSLRERTIKSVRVTFVASIFGAVVQAATLVVLARLLTPSDYGLVAGALIGVSVLQRLLFGNVESAIVLQREVTNRALSSVFVLMLAASFFLVVTVALIFSFLDVSVDFHNVVLGFLPVLMMSALAVVMRANLRRQMNFGRLMLIEIAAQLLGLTCASIVLASYQFGALSLVGGYLLQSLIQLALLFCLSNFRLAFDVRFEFAKPVVHTAFKLSAASFLEVAHGQIAPAFVGGVLGPVALGLFNRSYSLVQMPIQLISNAMSRVLYSTFSHVSHDTAKLRYGCQTLVEVGSSVILPVCFSVAASSHELVFVVLGAKWESAELLLPWLAVGSALSMTAHFLAVMVEAVGELGAKFKVQAVSTLFMILAFVVAVRFGIEWAAVAYGVGSSVFLIGQIIVCQRILKIGFSSILGWMLPGTLAGIAVGSYVLLLRSVFVIDAPIMLLLFEISGSGVVMFLFYLLFFNRILANLIDFSGIRALMKVKFLQWI